MDTCPIPKVLKKTLNDKHVVVAFCLHVYSDIYKKVMRHSGCALSNGETRA